VGDDAARSLLGRRRSLDSLFQIDDPRNFHTILYPASQPRSVVLCLDGSRHLVEFTLLVYADLKPYLIATGLHGTFRCRYRLLQFGYFGKLGTVLSGERSVGQQVVPRLLARAFADKFGT
jgi:hypothetical protein